VCLDQSEGVGTVPFLGHFDPTLPLFGTPDDHPQKNSTSNIPEELVGGKAAISVLHLSLVGAGPVILNYAARCRSGMRLVQLASSWGAFFETKNTTVNIHTWP
jgi:hypothetical protein